MTRTTIEKVERTHISWKDRHDWLRVGFDGSGMVHFDSSDIGVQTDRWRARGEGVSVAAFLLGVSSDYLGRALMPHYEVADVPATMQEARAHLLAQRRERHTTWSKGKARQEWACIEAMASLGVEAWLVTTEVENPHYLLVDKINPRWVAFWDKWVAHIKPALHQIVTDEQRMMGLYYPKESIQQVPPKDDGALFVSFDKFRESMGGPRERMVPVVEGDDRRPVGTATITADGRCTMTIDPTSETAKRLSGTVPAPMGFSMAGRSEGIDASYTCSWSVPPPAKEDRLSQLLQIPWTTKRTYTTKEWERMRLLDNAAEKDVSDEEIQAFGDDFHKLLEGVKGHHPQIVPTVQGGRASQLLPMIATFPRDLFDCFRMQMDESMPPGEIEIRGVGGTVVRIVNIGASADGEE